MKIALEVKAREAGQNAMCAEGLTGPEERGSAQCPDQDNTGEVKQEFVRVLQGC